MTTKLNPKWFPLITKDLAENQKEFAKQLDEMASVVGEIQSLTAPVALRATAALFRAQASAILSGSPPGNLFEELGALSASCEHLRQMLKAFLVLGDECFPDSKDWRERWNSLRVQVATYLDYTETK